MRQRRLKYLRNERGWSMRALGDACYPPVSKNYICMGEKWGSMYQSHLERVAKALEWEGDPEALLDEIEVAEVV